MIILRFVDEEYSRTGGMSGNILLDINNIHGSPVGDYCLDTIEFPPPPPDIQWIEPGHADGRTRSFYKHNNRELMIKLNIFGSSKSDLSNNIREVYEQFTVDKPILEFRGDGWTDSFYFDLISPPIEINTDDWFEPFIRDSVKINVMSNVEFHVEALPWLRGPDEELVIFKNLAPNPDMEDWAGGAPDHWTETTAAGSTIVEENAAGKYWTGPAATASSCELARVTGDCYVTTTDYIPVDITKHYQCDAWAKSEAGNPHLGIYVLCYSAAPALLGTLTISHEVTDSSTFWKHAYSREATRGVVEPADFPAGTTQVKIKIANLTDNLTIYIDTIYFGCTEYSSTHLMESPVGIVIPPGTVKGDVPAKAILYLDHIYGSRDFTELIIGQRLLYHDNYNPVVEFTTGAFAALYSRHLSSYYSIAAVADIMAAHNGDFENYAGSGNTTNWTDWTETRGAYTSFLGADTVTFYSGAASAAGGCSGSTAGSVYEILLSDLHAIDRTKTHLISIWVKSGSSGVHYINSTAEICFYNAGSVLVGSKTIVPYGHQTTSWKNFVIYAYPADMPATTTQMRIQLFYSGSKPPSASKHYYDFLNVYELAVNTVECLFPADLTQGRVLPTGSFSFDDATVYSDLTLATLIKDGAGTEVSSAETVGIVDIGDAHESFKEIALLFTGRWPIVSIPSIAIAEDADLSLLDQVFRISTESGLLAGTWYDCMTAIPVDKAFCQLWSLTSSHIILDSVSGLALTSTDGTLDTSSILNRALASVSPTFTAEQDGMNLAVLAVDNATLAGDNQVTPTYDLKMTYSPLYWMTLE